MITSNNQIEDLKTRLDIVKSSLDEVTGLTQHEDEKAARILTAMAFITAAPTAVLAITYTSKISYLFYGVNLIPLLFTAYMFFLSLGTIFMIVAFGPRFNVPKIWSKNPGASASNTPASIYFFEKIIEQKRATWGDYFTTVTTQDLLAKAYTDAINETYLISEKVAQKVRDILRGRFCYLLAILFMMMMVVIALVATL